MILKADISKTSTGRYLFLFIFICGNSKCTRIQKIKKFSGEVNWVPLALSDLDKSCMKHGGQLNKYFCKKNSNIPNDLAEIVNFHFSHYKSMGTISCHSNQSFYLTEIKNTTYVEANVLSMYAKFRLHPLYGF